MPVPNTGGVLRTKIADMQVGDYIEVSVEIPSRIATTNFRLGNVANYTTYSEVPVTGLDYSGGRIDKYFYMIKVDKGLLISDRVVQHLLSWDNMNQKEVIQGFPLILKGTIDGTSGIIRSLGGGNSFASALGTPQKPNAGLGVWPTDNEWDEYIVRKDYGTGPGRDDVWHWSGIYTSVQDTQILAISSANQRVLRGKGDVSEFSFNGSQAETLTQGFRPVFEYQEVSP